MFGSTSFGSQPTSSFGNFTAGANTTTASVFGQTQPNTGMQQMFGSGGGTTTGFNTPLKQTTFGPSFGSPSNVSPMFGSQQQNRIAPVAVTTGIFNQGSNSITPFIQGQAQGTSIPFNPLAGTDTMMRNGQPSPINTRHQCITCMKEYDNKSLEELRLEDYQLGRKGSAQTGMFGTTVNQQPTSIFSGLGTATAPSFGQQRTTTFGAPNSSSGLFANLSQPKPTSLFSNTNTGTTFGTPTFSFPATTTQPLLFNQNNNQASTTTTPFTFNQQPQTQMNLFGNKPLTAPTTTTTTFTGFGNTTLNKPLGIFASSASTPFGTTNTLGTSTASVFGQQQNKPFQPFTSFAAQPATQTFGQTPTSFSFPNPATSTTAGVTFGTPMFGSGTPSTGFNSFPTTTTSLGAPTSTAFPSFNFPSQQPSTGFSFFNNSSGTLGQPSNAQQTLQTTGPVPFATTPYKDSPLFYNLLANQANRSLEEMTKPTNPLAQRAIKEASRRRTSSHLASVTSPSSFGNLIFPIGKHSVYNKESSIFDGFEEDEQAVAVDILAPKSSVKRLSLKNVHGLSGLMYTGNATVANMSSTFSDSGRFDIDRNKSNNGEEYSRDANSDDCVTLFRSSAYGGESLLAGHPPQQFDNTFRETYSGINDSARANGYIGSKCRVISNRPGYYIQPDLEELDCLTQDDGTCLVEGFIIGRHNFGRIRFLHVVNVAGINIDEIVLFRHKETVVYPEDDLKPPVGEGINAPAEITMERVWPIDKSTRDPIKSPERVRSMNYEEKLRRSCKRMDAEFISYDIQLGIWTFRVKHFSKYSCAPEENEDEDVEALPPLKPTEDTGGLGGVKYSTDLFSNSVNETSVGVYPPPKKSRPPRVSELPKRKVMFSELGPTSDELADFTLAIQSPTEMPGRRKYSSARALLSDTTDMDFSDIIQIDEDSRPQQLLQKLKFDYHMSTMEDRVSKTIKSRIPVRQYRKRREVELVKIQKSFSMFSDLSSDRFTVTSGPTRGARVSFGHAGHFIQIVNTKSNRSSGGFCGKIQLLRIQPYTTRHQVDGVPNPSLAALKSQLEEQWKRIEYHQEGKLTPCSLGNISSQIETINTLRRNMSTRDISHVRTSLLLLGQEEQMWTLCKILWPPDQVANKFLTRFDPKFCHYQRKDLAEWMISNGSTLFGELFPRKDSSVGGLLRQGLKLDACEKAVSDKNYTLALCLAQNSYQVKEACDSQTVKWEKWGAENYISSELKELYQLCAGCPIWNPANLDKMSSSEWFQHFAIYNWYLAPAHETIPQVVASYQHFMNSVVFLPSGDTNLQDLNFPAVNKTEANIANLCINLLKAYSCDGYPMKKLLSPRSNNPDCLEYKISWLLMNNLMRFGFVIEEELYDTITNSFAGQLEKLECFEWAIFVIKHCEPSEERDILIKRILERNLMRCDDSKKEMCLGFIDTSATDIWDGKPVKPISKKEQALRIFGNMRTWFSKTKVGFL